MKKIVAIALFLFGAGVAVTLTAGLIFNQTSSLAVNSDANLAGQDFGNQTANSKQAALRGQTFSAAEVAKHDSAGDCWLIIQNKVYNVSDYLDSHPGNPETILPYCGREATQAFNTKDKRKPKPHSARAQEILRQYYLGEFSSS
jgi:cytochrome b involved in lipid metabolism